jgi:hypothetical protein
VLFAEYHVVIGMTGIDLSTLWAPVVSRINGPQSSLTFIALIPLVVLTASGRKFNRFTDESLGIFHVCSSHITVRIVTLVRLSKPF